MSRIPSALKVLASSHANKKITLFFYLSHDDGPKPRVVFTAASAQMKF